MRRGLPGRGRRLRWTRDAALLAVVAALVGACVCFAPLHQRAMLQALARTEVEGLHPVDAGLRLAVQGSQRDASGLPVTIKVTFDELVDEVPADVRRRLRDPVPSLAARLGVVTAEGRGTSGPVAWREGQCAHLRMTAGRCPTGPREIAVSRADRDNFGWRVGETVRSLEDLTGGVRAQIAGYLRLRVVGTYAQPDDDWWAGRVLTGSSGDPADPTATRLLHDTFVLGQAGAVGPRRVPFADPLRELDLGLDRDRFDVDGLLALGDRIGGLVRDPGSSYDVAVRSSLPRLAADVRRAERQAQVTVPLLVAQAALIGLVVAVLALQAAATARRSRVAVARLQGNSTRQARRLLAAELLPAVLAGVPVGMVAAVLLAAAGRAWVLPGSAPFELPLGFWLSGLVAAGVLTGTVVVVAAGTARLPITALLPRAPATRPLRGLGTGTAVVAAVATVLVVAVLTGGIAGPVGVLVPAVLALAGGLVLAVLLPRLLARRGRRALDRGRAPTGTGLLQASRRPATTQLVAVLTVGVALWVFATDAFSTAAHNRELAARQQVGAAVRATVVEGDVARTRAVLDAWKGASGKATVVTVHRGRGDRGQTVGVVPAELPAVLLDPPTGLDRALARLPAPVPAPQLTGQRLHGVVEWAAAQEDADPVQLEVEVVPAGQRAVLVPLGAVQSGAAARVRATLPCAGGCIVTSVRAHWDRPPGRLDGTITVQGLRLDGTPVQLGAPEDWQRRDDAPFGFLEMLRSSPGAGLIGVAGYGAHDLELRHRASPETLPVVRTAEVDGEDEVVVPQLAGIEPQPSETVARQARIPGIGNDTAVVDLDVLRTRGDVLGPDVTLEVWASGDLPGGLAALRTRLARADLHLDDVRTIGGVRERLDRSVPAWSLQLAVMVGASGLLLAVLALLLVSATSSGARARDLAALRMTGVAPPSLTRIVHWEVVPVIVVATLVGAVCGVVGGRLVLDAVPLFPREPEVSTLDLAPAWPTVLLAAGSALVVLVALVLLLARQVARRARLDLVRSAL